jgi:hypothetical protein
VSKRIIVIYMYIYQKTEKKLNVSVSCYLCGRPSAHIVDLKSGDGYQRFAIAYSFFIS